MENKKLIEGQIWPYLALISILATLIFPMITITSSSSQEKINLYSWDVLETVGIILYFITIILLIFLINYFKNPKKDMSNYFGLEIFLQLSIFSHVMSMEGDIILYGDKYNANIANFQYIIFLAMLFTYIAKNKAKTLYINYTALNKRRGLKQKFTQHKQGNKKSGVMSDKQIISILEQVKSEQSNSTSINNSINILKNTPHSPESYIARAMFDNANKMIHINNGLKKHPGHPLLLSFLKVSKGEPEVEDMFLYKQILQLFDQKDIPEEIRTILIEMKNIVTSEPFSIISYLGRMLLDSDRKGKYIKFAIEKYPECSSFILLNEKMNDGSLTKNDISRELAFQLAEKEFYEKLKIISDNKEFDPLFISVVRKIIKNNPTSVLSFLHRLLVDPSYIDSFVSFAPYYNPSNETIKLIISKLENNELTFEIIDNETQKEMSKMNMEDRFSIIMETVNNDQDTDLHEKMKQSLESNEDPFTSSITRAFLDPDNMGHHLKEALNADEDNAQLLLVMLMRYIENNEFNEAKTIADKLMKLDITPKALFYCAKAYFVANDFVKSLNIIDQYLDLEDNEFIDTAKIIKLVSIATTGSVNDVISILDNFQNETGVEEEIFDALLDTYSNLMKFDALNLINDLAFNYYPDNIRYNLLKINDISRQDIKMAIDQCYQLALDNPKNALVHMTLANLAINYEQTKNLGILHGIFAYKLGKDDEMVQLMLRKIPFFDRMIENKELIDSMDEELEQFLLDNQ